MSSAGSRTNKSFSFTRTKDFLNESETQRLQREVDTFTRQLEQEKRRLFQVEESYMTVTKEYKDLVKRMESQKSTGNAQRRQLNVKIHSLEKQLEQAIVRYNEIVASNKSLRDDVDVIRRERVTLNEVRTQLTEQYDKINSKIEDFSKKAKTRSELISEMKEKILQLKDKNMDQQNIYVEEFKDLQKEIKGERKRPQSLNRHNKKSEKVDKPLDTLEPLRRRITRLMLGNKEKVSVMEKYQKNMKVIDEAFNIVKETSGITDPEEIATTVIKSEEQNYSLFNYVNILTQEIDFLEENNKDLEEDINNLSKQYEQRLILMQQTPEEEIEKRKIMAVIDEKDRFINGIRKAVGVGQKPLEELLKLASKSPFFEKGAFAIHENFSLNEKTMDQYLEILETLVVRLIPYISKVNSNKEFTTGLLLEELNVKEFDKPHNVTAPNIKDISFSDESTYDQSRWIDESFMRQIAKDSVEKYKQNNSMLLGQSFDRTPKPSEVSGFKS